MTRDSDDPEGEKPNVIRGRIGRNVGTLLVLAGIFVLAGCGSDAVAPRAGGDVVLSLENLPPLDPTVDGRYEVWMVSEDGTVRSAGSIRGAHEPVETTLTNPMDDPAEVYVTVEPPGDEDGAPSGHAFLGGRFDGSETTLSIRGYVTGGPSLGLWEAPGTHVLFTSSNNQPTDLPDVPWRQFPSDEDAGIWLFNIDERTPRRDDQLCDPLTGIARPDWQDKPFFLKFSTLRREWAYQGWVVRDYGSRDEVWISYGKIRIDALGRANRQDDTGLGPFSGWDNYVEARLPRFHCFPGDDWVANPFGLELPDGIELPLDLNGKRDAAGNVTEVSRWTHVITIEPEEDRQGESPDRGPGAIMRARPFILHPYRNPIGEAGPAEPRTVEFHPESLPSGRATLPRQ